jgi:hypothetical protein
LPSGICRLSHSGDGSRGGVLSFAALKENASNTRAATAGANLDALKQRALQLRLRELLMTVAFLLFQAFGPEVRVYGFAPFSRPPFRSLPRRKDESALERR